MRSIDTDLELKHLEQRVLHYAHDVFHRTLPEMRFFILEPMEFASLLHKRVYPKSPQNLWEGKEMISTRYRVDSGQESSLYYEVVQTGRPSYAYLNETNSPMVQASVMAHVVGHCEFSELNVLHDSNDDRTERVMYLVNRVDRSRQGMGEAHYRTFWNAAESLVSLIAPNSQFNLESSVDTDILYSDPLEKEKEKESSLLTFPYSYTLSEVIQKKENHESLLETDNRRKSNKEALNRRGYKLKAPCQDIMGFLRKFAPASTGERNILDYLYTVNSTSDFVIRTQIMNEGWAMYWEHKIMKKLFEEKACTGIIDYCKIFAGVCYPRPYYQRNPYHLGYYMWNHIEELYEQGKVSLEFVEETDVAKKAAWDKPSGQQPLKAMEHIIETCTDYEFLRRFLTTELIDKFHLNRIPKSHIPHLKITANDVAREDRQFVWVNPEPVKEQMLNFFTHFHRPRIYLIDVDFMEGGLLLYHRDDGRDLRRRWIRPTLKNINMIWKGPVSLLCRESLYTLSAGKFKNSTVEAPPFEHIVERMQEGRRPFVL
ncbi:MAG: SpoVR family protein [Verrucomicrobiales bacterium]|nr:SpoVR family protein [Verrucomicrobiales bacterium]